MHEIQQGAAARKGETSAACTECGGRGWHPGDCHPHEVCGICDGFGWPDIDRPRCVMFDGNRVRCDRCKASADWPDRDAFIEVHRACMTAGGSPVTP